MIDNYPNLIIDIETGQEIDAFEAAKKIACNKLKTSEIKQLSSAVANGVNIYNKEAATYALSWIENRSQALAILIDILSTSKNHERVRGQAAEGIGLIRPSRKFKLRMVAEKILLDTLNDPSPIIRFWSCYAVGELKMKEALPILKELQEKDSEFCPGWWYISEEAEDAVAKINNRKWKDRVPINQRVVARSY